MNKWKWRDDWPERNAQIIAMRLDKYTYRDIGDRFDISKERVRQIISKHVRELMNGPPRLTLRAWWAICTLLSEHTTLQVLMLPQTGMTTLREVVNFMHRRRFWLEYDENGTPLSKGDTND